MKVPAWRRFTQHPYPVEIVAVTSGRHWKALQAQIPQMGQVDGFDDICSSGSTTYVTEDGAQPIIVVTLRASTANTAAHEATHVVQYIEETINQRLDEETEAYMVGALTSWLLGVLSRTGRTVTAS